MKNRRSRRRAFESKYLGANTPLEAVEKVLELIGAQFVKSEPFGMGAERKSLVFKTPLDTQVRIVQFELNPKLIGISPAAAGPTSKTHTIDTDTSYSRIIMGVEEALAEIEDGH